MSLPHCSQQLVPRGSFHPTWGPIPIIGHEWQRFHDHLHEAYHLPFFFHHLGVCTVTAKSTKHARLKPGRLYLNSEDPTKLVGAWGKAVEGKLTARGHLKAQASTPNHQQTKAASSACPHRRPSTPFLLGSPPSTQRGSEPRIPDEFTPIHKQHASLEDRHPLCAASRTSPASSASTSRAPFTPPPSSASALPRGCVVCPRSRHQE